jgi:hypothetical protein
LIDEAHLKGDPWLIAACEVAKLKGYGGELMSATRGDHTELGNKFSITEKACTWQNFEQLVRDNPGVPFLSHGFVTAVILPRIADTRREAEAVTNKHSNATAFSVYSGQEITTLDIETAKKRGPVIIFATPIIENGVNLDLDCIVDAGLRVVTETTVRSDQKMTEVTRRVLIGPYSTAQRG